jgi:hypothetical protein
VQRLNDVQQPQLPRLPVHAHRAVGVHQGPVQREARSPAAPPRPAGADLRGGARRDDHADPGRADASANNNHYVWGARAFFYYGFCALYLFVYSGLAAKILQAPQPQILMNVNLIFAGVMLGCIGIPAVIEALKQIMGLPGDSQVKVLREDRQ